MSILGSLSGAGGSSWIRKASTILGAALGLAAVAFFFGLLAQRAQYGLARIPFVFVDYWAYAELGLWGIVDSAYLFLKDPAAMTFIVVISIVAVFSLRSERFQRWFVRPQWTFIGTCALLLLLVLVVRQQLAVRALQVNRSITTGAGSSTDTTLPVRWPFSLSVAEAAPVPQSLPAEWPETAVDCWNLIARELEQGAEEQSTALALRPRPLWASSASNAREPTLLGVPTPSGALPEARARELYAGIFTLFIVCVWGFAVLRYWQRLVLRTLQDSSSGAPAAAGPWALRHLARETWFATKYVLRPLSVVLLVTSGTLLMPETYGALAMPHIGEEMVEVDLSRRVPRRADPEATDSLQRADEHAVVQGEAPDTDSDDHLVSFLKLAMDYQLADLEHRGKHRDKWRAKCDKLEQSRSPAAALVLDRVVDATVELSPDLASVAADALGRLREQVSTSQRGYILHYPRSESEHLGIIRSSISRRVARWSIHPLPTKQILSIRVVRQHRARELAELLRQMQYLKSADARQSVLARVMILGHERTLEVMLAALHDHSHRVVGSAATAVGAYASALQGTPDGILRKRRAARVLLRLVADHARRPDIRGAAATALGTLAGRRDTDLGEQLLGILTEPQIQESDPKWILRGTIHTALAKIQYRPAVPHLVTLLGREDVPVETQTSIPSVLSQIGERPQSTRALLAQLARSQTPHWVVATSLTALGFLGHGDSVTVEALCKFCRGKNGKRRFGEEWERLQGAAVSALSVIGDSAALETLRELAFNGAAESEAVRILSMQVLGEMHDDDSEDKIMDIAEDVRQSLDARSHALLSLGKMSGSMVTRRLIELHRGASARLASELKRLIDGSRDLKLKPEIRKSFVLMTTATETLTERADQGDGRARNYLNDPSRFVLPPKLQTRLLGLFRGD